MVWPCILYFYVVGFHEVVSGEGRGVPVEMCDVGIEAPKVEGEHRMEFLNVSTGHGR